MQCNGFFSKIRYFVILLSREGFILSSRDKKKNRYYQIKWNEIIILFSKKRKKKDITYFFSRINSIYFFCRININNSTRIYTLFFTDFTFPLRSTEHMEHSVHSQTIVSCNNGKKKYTFLFYMRIFPWIKLV